MQIPRNLRRYVWELSSRYSSVVQCNLANKGQGHTFHDSVYQIVIYMFCELPLPQRSHRDWGGVLGTRIVADLEGSEIA